ncbi:TetR/AcrR family transcriptional regulator [Loktanella agnita]|uniref:TetR/AcrR family transcriptional regulator n=1 Tax=Loktanella agnita TaxID=287097 RepID=UPI00398A2DF8
MSDLPPATKPHHHGNLRAALVQAGLSILASEGLQALTLRRCAQRAGVSHAAPAHHFDGLVGLKGAIAQQGLVQLRNTMLAASGDAGGDLARLRAICRGYLDFATAHPALFRLMFGFEAHERQHMLSDGNAAAYDVLRTACRPFVTPDRPASVLETQVWSLIHGYSTLYLAGNLIAEIQAVPDGGPFADVMAALDRIVGG